MNTNDLRVGYLKRVATNKDGSCTIYNKTLHSVLDEQAHAQMPKPEVLNDEIKAKHYKESYPGIFPIDIHHESLPYTDDVFKYGNLVFIDIDTTEGADDMFSRADELKTMMPSLVAVWYSLRGKLHFAFLCHWQNNIEFGACWRLLSNKLMQCVQTMLGKCMKDTWDHSNDHSLSTCKHLMAAGWSRGYKWYDEADLFTYEEVEFKEAHKLYEYRSIDFVKVEPNSLFTDEEVMKRWEESTSFSSFVNWCEKKRGYVYKTQDNDYQYVVEYAADGPLYVWKNDGSVHRFKTVDNYYKMSDKRKRNIARFCEFTVCYITTTFEEVLYAVTKYYVENCFEHSARYNPKDIILSRAENACGNIRRVKMKCEAYHSYCETRQVVIGDKYADDTNTPVGKSTKLSAMNEIKIIDRRNKLLELHEDGDTLEVLVLKMRSNGYGHITDTVVYKIAVECGIKCNKPQNKYKGKYEGRYQYAYTIDGKRTMVLASKIDNITYFATKALAEEHHYNEVMKDYKEC